MRVLVCGGRTYDRKQQVFDTLDRIQPSLVIQGCARGADQLAAQWCTLRRVACLYVYADWDKYGKAAGMIRNRQMLEIMTPDLVVAFPGGRGTANMIAQAHDLLIPVEEI